MAETNGSREKGQHLTTAIIIAALGGGGLVTALVTKWVREPCKEGEVVKCGCSGDRYGSKICEDGKWGTCVCRPESTPQAPLGTASTHQSSPKPDLSAATIVMDAGSDSATTDAGPDSTPNSQRLEWLPQPLARLSQKPMLADSASQTFRVFANPEEAAKACQDLEPRREWRLPSEQDFRRQLQLNLPDGSYFTSEGRRAFVLNRRFVSVKAGSAFEPYATCVRRARER